MAQIVINEISDNYTFNTGVGAFATVALPITAAWGPAYLDPMTVYGGKNDIAAMLDDTKWYHFPATQQGLESFVAAYRGPSSNYKLAGDYSYQIAMTLLGAGYDVLVCRVSAGTAANKTVGFTHGALSISAKYVGSFGNNIKLSISKITYNTNKYCYNVVVYVADPSTGAMTAAENLTFTLFYNEDDIPTIDEITSNFVVLSASGIQDGDDPSSEVIMPISLEGGTDKIADIPTTGSGSSQKWYAPLYSKPTDWDEHYANYYVFNGSAYVAADDEDWGAKIVFKQESTASAGIITAAGSLAEARYYGTYTANSETGYRYGAGYTSATAAYPTTVKGLTITDVNKLTSIRQMEWTYYAAFLVYQLLKDKLNYNPNRIMSAWDDQNPTALNGVAITSMTDFVVSPLHKIIMDTAFYSRCATGYLDLPKSLPRALVYNADSQNLGYVQKLSEEGLPEGETSNNAPLYTTNSAVFGPWAPYRLVSMQKQVSTSPSLIALLIHRAQVLNQAAQYEWILPSNRKHNLKIGEPDYSVSTKLLNIWQKLDGVGVNVITKIPDLGTNVWGNSTLFDVPPATYQALANLSTRWLVNAIEDVVYRCGIAITFQYNNEQAYGKFYAGVSPILDTMINVGAIEDYKIKMSADINGLDQVNANTVIGKIWLVVNGVVNDIVVDLIALPQGTSLAGFGE